MPRCLKFTFSGPRLIVVLNAEGYVALYGQNLYLVKRWEKASLKDSYSTYPPSQPLVLDFNINTYSCFKGYKMIS